MGNLVERRQKRARGESPPTRPEPSRIRSKERYYLYYFFPSLLSLRTSSVSIYEHFKLDFSNNVNQTVRKKALTWWKTTVIYNPSTAEMGGQD